MSDVTTILSGLSCGRPRCECNAAVAKGRGLTHCPAHDRGDGKPDLNVSLGDGNTTLVHCHVGCSQDVVITALAERGLWQTTTATFPSARGRESFQVERKLVGRGPVTAEYVYRNADGSHARTIQRDANKNFWVKEGAWPADERVLYHLPEVLAAIAAGETVWIVEGEKDADALKALRLVATTSPFGADKWLDRYSLDFVNAVVVIVADSDEPGRRHARQVAESLSLAGRSVKVIELPQKDASDYIVAGGTKESLVALAERSPSWANQILTGKDLAEMYRDVMARRMAGDIDYVGFETGLGELDKYISYRPGDLWLVVAATGVGKSALLGTMQMDLDRRGITSLMVSLEMSWIVIVERLITAGVTLDELEKRVGLLVDEPSLTLEKLEALAKIARLRGARVLFVDYAQRMSDDHDSEYERVSAISNGLARIARETRLCIVAAAQVSRQGAGRDGQPPRLADIRASGHLEQDAAVVLSIGRKSGDVMARLEIQKNRHGKVSYITIEFDPEHGKFITEANTRKAETRNWTPREAEPVEIPL